jgi:hypothetical protein
MTQMSWTHSSKILALGVVLALALGTVGIASAVTFDDSGVPEDAEVGEQTEVEVVMEDPFEGQPDSWTLQASSELQDANVNIRAQTVGGDTIAGDNGQITLNADDGIESVEIVAQGTVPEIDSYNYENPEEENFVAVAVSGGVQNQWEVHRYTEGSQNARDRIDQASESVSEDNSDLQSAISLYNNGDFEQSMAEADSIIDSQESQEQSQSMLLFAGAGVVLLVLLGGGYYLYSQKQKNTNKLQ